MQAVDVSRLSAIGAEDERLILPGTMFEVKSSMDAGGGLRIVQVEQVEGAPSLIAGVVPTAVPASGQPSASGKVGAVVAWLTDLWGAIVLTIVFRNVIHRDMRTGERARCWQRAGW
jgi:hypothetical protein